MSSDGIVTEVRKGKRPTEAAVDPAMVEPPINLADAELTRDQTIEERILADPVGMYREFRERLDRDGPNASFPEFEPVFLDLWGKLNDPDFLRRIEKHQGLVLEYNEVKTFLSHVNLQFSFDDEASYPYSLPFKGRFPYRPTIDAFENVIRLMDKLDRLEPNTEAKPLYHFDRYAYHRHNLLADPDVVLFPTLRELNFEDLIRVRSVPLGFVGITPSTIRADRHFQSPLDFWYHDLNHVRRMWAYLALRAEVHGAHTLEQKLDFYSQMDQFITEKVIPKIDVSEDVDPHTRMLRKLAKVIIFEIVHETALTLERDTLLVDLLRGPGPQPFEHMKPSQTFVGEDVESLRTATGNLESGASKRATKSGEPITIRYFHDRALALLANIYNKLNFGFYDDPDDIDESIATLEERRANNLIEATKYVFIDIIGADPAKLPNDQELRKLILSMEGNPEKFVYRRLQPHEGMQHEGTKVSEPISADSVLEAFNQMRAGGKSIFTLFGYSLLDYEQKRTIMGAIREELEKLDPKEWVINIGATEDGIGAAYFIAKELGFKTTGIVSTQALMYSGKFSPYVDEIYVVNDAHWGGYVPGTNKLAPTTTAFLSCSDVISAYGGGANTAAMLNHVADKDIEIRFTSAEMNHEKAISEAARQGLAKPEKFTGYAEDAWNEVKLSLS